MLKRKTLCFMLCSTLLIGGCAATEIEETDSSEALPITNSLNTGNPKDLPKHIDAQIENGLTIDADIRTWGLSTYELSDYFISKKNYSASKDEAISLASNLLSAVGKEEYISNIEYIDDRSYYIVTLNEVYGNGMCISPDCAAVRTDSYIKNVGLSTFTYYYGQLNTREQFHTNQDLTFGSISEYAQEARTILCNMGFEIVDDYDCYTLESSNNIQLNEGGNIGSVGSLGDDCYCYIFYHGIDNIPFCRMESPPNEDDSFCFQNKYIICLNDQGVLGINAGPTYQIQQEGSMQPILLPGNLLEQQITRFRNLIPAGEITLTEISLEYYITPEENSELYHAVPVWVFYYTQHQTFTGDNTYEIDATFSTIYNAITGEVLRTS